VLAAVFDRSGIGRNLGNRAFTPASPSRGKGSGAPSARLVCLLGLVALALLIVPATASATPPTLTINSVSPSITTAHVVGVAQPEECANQAFRIAQHATHLPACRAFEKVSPADKGLGDIVGDGSTTIASRFGDAVAFNSRTPFGDTVGSGNLGQTEYVARRSDEAWVVHAITPTPRPDARQSVFAPTLVQLYSEDLRTAIVRAYDLPVVTDDTPLRNSIYVEDTATRALETVTVSQVDPPTLFDFLSYPSTFWGISADARHVAFVAQATPFGVTQFLPDAAPGVPNVYKWDDGVLRVASVLPDGNVAANGADTPEKLRGAMSADGSRLLFTASTGGNPQLYLEIDGGRTAWVSETELDPSDPNYQPDPSNVQVMGMTPDGRNVFFSTDTPLLPGDTNGGTDLYRYTDSADPTSDSNLTMISQDGDFAGGDLIGMSDDGERVYDRTKSGRTVLWDHGATSLIDDGGIGAGGLGQTASPGSARVSPDGMFLALVTDAALDPGKVTNGHREMYLYSLKDGSFVCASCPPGSAAADVTVLPAVTNGNVVISNAGFRPRFLSDSGQVFFSTADPLVAEDTNGVLDAYEFDPATGEASLLSTGTGKDPATFTDASASGADVFIVTRQRLVASDRDDFVDLYDVREGGGLPEPVEVDSPPCQGEGCKSASSATPIKPQNASSQLGAGNVHRPARCKKNQRKVRRHGKVRCVRKHHPRHHKRANTNRRAGR
jgi:hypothetical protein